MGDVPTHWEDSSRISLPSYTPTDGSAANMLGGLEVGLPTFFGVGGGGGLGGCGEVFRTPPEHSCTVHINQIHNVYFSVDGGSRKT